MHVAGGEPDDDVLALAHGKPRKVVRRRLGDEERNGLPTFRRGPRVTIARPNDRGVDACSPRSRGSTTERRAARCRIDERRIDGVAVREPQVAVVEVLERRQARGHVREAAQPDEPVGIVEVVEEADELHPRCLERLEQLALEELDELVATPGLVRVLPQLDDHRANQSRSGTLTSSTEKSPLSRIALAASAMARDRDPRERAADADALRAGLGDLGEGQAREREHVDGLRRPRRRPCGSRRSCAGPARRARPRRRPRTPGAARSCRRGRGCRGCGSRRAR